MTARRLGQAAHRQAVGAFETGDLGFVAYVGVALWCVGMVFETVGDAQMERCKKWRKAQ